MTNESIVRTRKIKQERHKQKLPQITEQVKKVKKRPIQPTPQNNKKTSNAVIQVIPVNKITRDKKIQPPSIRFVRVRKQRQKKGFKRFFKKTLDHIKTRTQTRRQFTTDGTTKILQQYKVKMSMTKTVNKRKSFRWSMKKTVNFILKKIKKV